MIQIGRDIGLQKYGKRIVILIHSIEKEKVLLNESNWPWILVRIYS